MRIQQQIAQAQASGKAAAILDAALLFEAGWDQVCDQVIFVDCPWEIRQTRALGRGWSAEQFVTREAAQLPVENKRERADFVVENSGSPEATQQQVVTLWNRLFPRSTIAAKEGAEQWGQNDRKKRAGKRSPRYLSSLFPHYSVPIILPTLPQKFPNLLFPPALQRS